MNRRGFLGAILAAGVAPAIVRSGSLMRVFARAESGLFVPELPGLVVGTGNTLLTPSIIARECLAILKNQLSFTQIISEEFPSGRDKVVVRYTARYPNLGRAA